MAGLGAYGGAGLFSSLAGPGMAVTNPQAAQIATAQTAQAAPIMDVTGAATAAEQSAIQNALISPEYQYIAPPTEYANPFTGQAIGADYAYGPQVQADLARQAQYGERVASLVKDNVNFDPQLSENLRQMQKLGGPESARAIMGEFPPPLTSAESIVPSVGTPISPEEHLQAMSKLTGAPPSNSVDFLSGMSDVSAVEGPGVAGAGLPTRSSTFASRLAAMPTKDLAKYGLAAAAPVLLAPPEYKKPELDSEQYRYAYSPGPVMPPTRSGDIGEYTYFRPSYTRLAEGGPVEAMSAANIHDMQNARGGVSDMGIDNSTGMQRMAGGGISDLGDYSDGGRLLRGPGDGVSDSIPAVIGDKRPARLADGEFVVPARIVSELGNGSTDAGARKLYAMMDRIQSARGKTTGKGKVAKNTRSEKYLPA